MKPLYHDKKTAGFSFSLWENRYRRGMNSAAREDRWLKKISAKHARRKLREMLRNGEFDAV